MLPVLSMLSTIFCAVPALRRVDPISTSGPVLMAIVMSDMGATSGLGLQLTEMASTP